jgi:FkbM family methyltransferase
MTILERKQQYLDGGILKNDFFEEMHANYLILNEYAEYLQRSSTEIKRIILEKGKVYMVTYEDIILLCNFRDVTGIPLTNLSLGYYEKLETSLVLNMIHDGGVVLDIGGNYGWYSLNIAKRFPNTTIHAFEPITYTYNIFEENIKLNNFSNINVYNIGIGKENSVLEFNYNPDRSGATSLSNLLERENVEKIRCDVRILDEFVAEKNINRIDFIKIDIEGAELFALQGAKKVLQQFQPKLFVEMLRKWSAKFNYHPNDIISYMAELGYQCFEINNERLLKFDTMTDDTKSTNFFFLHKKKHAALIEEMIAPHPTP